MSEIALNENTACDGCENFNALEIGGRKLCADCLAFAGGGCAGSSADAAVE